MFCLLRVEYLPCQETFAFYPKNNNNYTMFMKANKQSQYRCSLKKKMLRKSNTKNLNAQYNTSISSRQKIKKWIYEQIVFIEWGSQWGDGFQGYWLTSLRPSKVSQRHSIFLLYQWFPYQFTSNTSLFHAYWLIENDFFFRSNARLIQWSIFSDSSMFVEIFK